MKVSPRLRNWLTGPSADPSVRARFWLEVDGRRPEDPKVRSAVKEIGRDGWASELLAFQLPDGHWVTPGTSARELYNPKYVVTNWMAIVLAELGMTRSDPRIRRTAEMVIRRWGKKELAGSDAEICITGNCARYLIRFGYLGHPVVQASVAWILKTQKADGGWHCFRSKTGTLDSWEGLAALAEIPEANRSEEVRRSIERGSEFFLRHHLMGEGKVRYPPWFRIHYPNHYYYDLLVGLRILTKLGYGSDPRMAPALRWLKSKRAADGTWALDAAHPDLDSKRGGYVLRRIVFPMMLESLNLPSRWATVEALSILTKVEAA